MDILNDVLEQFFNLLDKEKKGFIYKGDLQILFKEIYKNIDQDFKIKPFEIDSMYNIININNNTNGKIYKEDVKELIKTILLN